MFDLSTRQEDRLISDHATKPSEPGEKAAAPVEVAPVSLVHGEGQHHQVSVYGKRGTLRLQGRTDADFDGGSFRTKNVVVRRATDCKGCAGKECVHVRGSLVAAYSVATRVTLPRVADYPDLTPCQRQRVRDAIDNVLTPHEQQHVTAFNTYNGATSRRFDLTLCRSNFESTIRTMFEAEESARRSAAQAASDALDPFHFDVDLNCEDTPETGPEKQAAEEGEPGTGTEE